MAFSEDVPKRFEAYGWHTQRVEDGNDVAAIEAAIEAAQSRRPTEPDRRPNAHRLRQPEQAGQPEGARIAARPRRGPAHEGGLRLGSGPHVLRPRRGRRPFPRGDRRGRRPRRGVGGARSSGTPAPTPTHAAEFRRRIARTLPDGWDAGSDVRGRRRGRDPERQPGRDPGARRAAAGAVRRRRGPLRVQPDRRQGRAELQRRRGRAGTCDSASASTAWAAIANGIAYHGGFIPYCATFLTFSDYMRGSVRLASLSGIHVVVRLDARLRRARRGRPDAPARRALRGAPRDPEPVVRPTRRRERDRGRLGARRRARGRTGRARPDAPEAAGRCRGPRSRRARASTAVATSSATRPAATRS